MTNEEVHRAASAAEDVVQKYLYGKQGFLGARIARTGKKLMIQVDWLELTAIPPLPATVHEIGIVVMPVPAYMAEQTESTVVGGWLDDWKETSVGWHDSIGRIRSYW